MKRVRWWMPGMEGIRITSRESKSRTGQFTGCRSSRSAAAIEQRVQLSVRDGLRKCVEGPAPGDFPGGGEKSRPRRSRERAAHADAAHAEIRQLRDGCEVSADEGIHRPRCHSADEGAKLIEVA